MQPLQLPILYSFCRCPYAMRARMALLVSGTVCRLREVRLSDKPAEMIAVSAKATVPVFVLPDGTVIDESIAVMRWVLERNDPRNWLAHSNAAQALIAANDGEFKHHLDRYKYANRYQDNDPEELSLQHRRGGEQFLVRLERLLQENRNLLGAHSGIADYAIFPFIRQFANHDRDWFDNQPYPRLQAWLTGHLQSELFTISMKKYKPWQSGETEPLWPEPLAAALQHR